MLPQPTFSPGMTGQWEEDGHSDPPSTRSSNDAPDHMSHIRSQRLSVFSGRSRSNTTTSTSSRRSPGSSMTSVDSSVPSQDERTTSAIGMRPEKDRSRSFLARGSRILRRQGSKINIVATLDEEDEIDREAQQPKMDKPDMFGRRARRTDNHERLKSLISDPFDFHHLTHTSPSQFPGLELTRENDLVTEFSVIRASQRPEAVLKGIRADDIHFRNFSTEDLAAYGTATTADAPTPQSPPGSPAASGSTSPTKLLAPGFEISPILPYHTAPPPSVPESESETDEPAPRAIDEILGLSSGQTYLDYMESAPSPQLEFGPDLNDKQPRAYSMSSHYSLDDVPEEEEATRLWEASPDASTDYAHSRSTSQVSPGTVEPRSCSVPPKAPLSIFVAEELSRKFSEALGSPTLPQTLPSSSPNAHGEITPPGKSGVHQFSYEDELYDSWDADIDYCYEHAAESTSDFDWSRTSFEEAQRPKTSVACSDESLLGAPKTRHLQPSPLSTSTLPTPDLDSSPARSSTLHSAVTPSTTEFERDFMTARTSEYFHPVASTLSKQINQETLYEDYITTDAQSDQHFPFHQGMMASDNPVSPRSSFSPISKCNSQESLMLSRAASIARKHRSSVSTTSVPELIHSLSSSRELMPTDRLTASETLNRPPSAHHRQTKSLEAHLLLQAGSNNVSASDLSLSSLTHDRAKSISEVDVHPVDFPLPSVPSKNPTRPKKTRKSSYSLFPTAQ
ncbi:hypothetical protein N7448_005581 [Penicillium atrosanguineum]|nr:hypothetical protein N7448_005581 [Penicillium atrosanguineum]